MFVVLCLYFHIKIRICMSCGKSLYESNHILSILYFAHFIVYALQFYQPVVSVYMTKCHFLYFGDVLYTVR